MGRMQVLTLFLTFIYLASARDVGFLTGSPTNSSNTPSDRQHANYSSIRTLSSPVQYTHHASRSVLQSDQAGVQYAALYDHKTLLPMAAQDVMLFICSFVILALAAGAGIGKRFPHSSVTLDTDSIRPTLGNTCLSPHR